MLIHFIYCLLKYIINLKKNRNNSKNENNEKVWILNRLLMKYWDFRKSLKEF